MEDRCVSCGAIIPEGRQVCEDCEELAREALARINHYEAEVKRLTIDMNDKKFTDDEVIKALECCVEGTSEACWKCVFGLTPPYPVCKTVVEKYALDLINRQKATIESMAKLVEGFEENCNTAIKIIDRWEKAYASAKAEAIEEFAKRLHERLYSVPTVYNSHFGRVIDNLVKEMTEGGE